MTETQPLVSTTVAVSGGETVPPFRHTPIEDIKTMHARQRVVFAARQRLSREDNIQARKSDLRQLIQLVDQNEDLICRALAADFMKPPMEAKATETDLVRTEAWETLQNLDSWLSPRDAATEGVQRFDKSQIKLDPKGTVLIIAPSNYPCQLALLPLIGCLAAGNTAVLKLSEITTHVAALLTHLIPKYLDNVVQVVNGGRPETEVLLNELRWDHIFFTGSVFVGRIVAAAAAKHLTTVTLELGGKSPVYVDADSDIEIAARRVAWGKCINGGQTCIAPDFVLIHPSVKQKFIDGVKAAWTEFYGQNVKASPDFARMINESYYKRVKSLLSCGKVVVGGDTDDAQRFIAPTVLVAESREKEPEFLSSKLMTEEIFGPLLPVIDCDSVDGAIDFINKREHPLALYIFCKDSDKVQRMLDGATAGGVTVNDCIMHITVSALPFGGVGESGIGAYHGQRSIAEFSHEKGVLYKKVSFDEPINKRTRYAPYSDDKLALIRRLLIKDGTSCCHLPSLHSTLTFVLFCAVVVLAVLLAIK